MAGSQADFWQGPTGLLPVVNAAGNVFEETQTVVTPGQSLFTLLTFTYTPNTHSIFVWRNTPTGGGIGGELLRRGSSYLETASNQVTIVGGTNVGDTITFIAFAINQLTPPIVNNGLPVGGSTGSVLQKSSSSDYDASWIPQLAVSTLLDAVRSNVASASTVNLVALQNTTRNINITGNIQIDGFQITNGEVWAVRFSGALTLKNNAAIVTQTGADVVTTANATCFLRAIADNTVEVISYTAPNGPLLASNLNTGPFGRRNFFYNGGMTNAQRGTQTLAATGAINTALDGWLYAANATTVAASVSQLASGANSATGCAMVTVITTTGTTGMSWNQRIESKNSKKFSGKTVTVSGRIRHTAAVSLSMQVNFVKPNALDNFSGVTGIGGGAPFNALNGGVDTDFSSQFTLGATDADNGMDIGLYITGAAAMTAVTFVISNMQIEIGGVATPFEHHSAAQSDIDAKRYLWCTNSGTPKGGAAGSCSGVAITTSIIAFPGKYPVAMRAVPTVQLWQNGVQNQVRDLTTGVPVAATISALTSHTVNGFGLVTLTAAVLTIGRGYDFDLIVSAELV